MTRILIIGAHGQIARVATQLFLERQDTELTLYLRNSARLKALARHPRVRIVEGDALDPVALTTAMAGQDVVYANLSGPMEQQARHIVRAMQATGLRRLIFIASMGIYAEVPGQQYGSVLDPYCKAAAVVEASGLDYTILRPAWLDDRDDIAYGTTHKGEAFQAADETVSRKSVADMVVRLAVTPGMEIGASVGIHRDAGA